MATTARSPDSPRHAIFLADAMLDAFAPEHGHAVDAAALPSSPQRTTLYVDEVVPVCVVLRAPLRGDGEGVEAQVGRLAATLEVYAVGMARPGPEDQDRDRDREAKPVPVKDLVDEKALGKDEEPVIVVADVEEEGEEAQRCVYVIWRTEVHVNRSRIRSVNASIYFSATVTNRSPGPSDSSAPSDDYLPSGEPGSINLLEAFKSAPAFRHAPAPVLSAARLSKVIPAGAGAAAQSPSLRNESRTLLRLAPVLNSRVRTTRVGASPSTARVLACVDVEVSAHATGSVSLETVGVVLAGGRAASVGGAADVTLPRTCQPRDAVALVYTLQPEPAGARETAMRSLTFGAAATLSTPQGTHHRIRIGWRTGVDLANVLRRPALAPPRALQPTGVASPRSSADTADGAGGGGALVSPLATLTVRTASRVRSGAQARWRVQVTNRSATRTLRLTVVPVTQGAATAAAAAAAAAVESEQKALPVLPTASAFRSSRAQESIPVAARAPQLVPLSADLNLGPVGPGASATGDMVFLVQGTGAVGLEGVRLVDLDSDGVERGRYAEHVLVGKSMLPDVIAVPAEAGR